VLRFVVGAFASQLQATAVASGMRPLHDAAAERVRNGETTLEEIDRELGEADTAIAAPHLAPHILLAEDDTVTRGIAKATLVNNGFRVSEARDGVAALEQLQASPDISLLVLDLEMPRMTGQEVLRKLRASLPTSQLPVVVLTGATDDTIEVEMMDAGADDYVRKPLEPARFVARIKAALRRAER
jgi:CheY-like chemotaxis protein